MSRAVERIKEKLNIVSVVESYVALKKAGIHHKGLCPFHNERTPSFTVSAERNSYYCFGCGAKGDIFSFVQEYEGIDFKQALTILAERAGVNLDDDSFKKEKKIDKSLYGVMSLASEYYISELQKNPEVEKYLLGRGLTKSTITSWEIGFAKNDWRNLHDFLLEKGITVDQMLKTGLVKKKDGGAGVYDVFRGRVVFPIKDVLGRIVAFTGRILVKDDNLPKYLNTPETEIFNKSEVLYGLEKAKQSIRKLDYIIVVEGQMDVIMSHQAGVKNAVASSGTAFTTSHLSKISPLTKRIIFAFDSDNAGISAMKRSALLAIKAGFDVKALVLVGSKDPADMVKENPQLWVLALKGSKSVIDYLLNTLLDENGTDTRLKLKKVSSEIIPFVSAISSPIEKAHYVKKIADLFSIAETAVWNEVAGSETKKEVYIDDTKTNPKDTVITGSEMREKIIMGALFLCEHNGGVPFADSSFLKSEIIRIRGENELEKLREKYGDKKEELIFKAEELFLKQEGGDPKMLLQSLLQSFEIEYIDKKISVIKQQMKFAEQKGDSEKSAELLSEYDKEIEKKHKLIIAT